MRSFLRAVVSCVFLVAAFSAQADWVKVHKDFESAKTPDEAVRMLDDSYQEIEENTGSEDLRELIDDFKSATTKEAKDSTYQSIKDLISANVVTEQYSAVSNADATARQIKSKNPLYKKERESSSSTWIQKLLERLKHLFDGERSGSQPDLPQVPKWIPNLILGIFYVLCGGIILGLIYLLTKIPWAWTRSARAKKARGGMLEEGEELLTEDEYMLEADRLIAEGKFREACRALYLASLLRIDAARIARFEPTQTNWEHLRRIETSKTRPPELEFRATTKAYDHAWYGFTAKSIADVAIFQDTYLTIKRLTEVAR